MARPTKNSRKELLKQDHYVPLEDLDWNWRSAQIRIFLQMWEDGSHISDIAKAVGKEVDEVAILIMDLRRKGIIEKRKGGVLGWH